MKTKILNGAVLFLTFFIFSCSKEEVSTKEINNKNLPELVNNRLVFKNFSELDSATENSAKMKDVSRLLKTQGFRPLKDKIENSKFNYADFVIYLYNEEGEIQIGNEIYLIRNDKQYIILNKDETLLLRVKEDLDNNVITNYKNVVIKEIMHKKIDIDKKSDKWLDAQYQKEFNNATGGRYKFVFEAYMDGYYFYNNVYLTSGVRAKLEWLHGRTWKPAGEPVYKSISNLNFVITPNFGNSISKNIIHVSQLDNQNLVVLGPSAYNFIGPMNYNIKVQGNFYAQMRDPNQANYSYSKFCVWDANVTF